VKGVGMSLELVNSINAYFAEASALRCHFVCFSAVIGAGLRLPIPMSLIVGYSALDGGRRWG